MIEVVLVRAWDSETFHQKVLEHEAKGYSAQLDTYRITPETNPETGEILHLYSIEMSRPDDASKEP